jgi:hypothetical protein
MRSSSKHPAPMEGAVTTSLRAADDAKVAPEMLLTRDDLTFLQTLDPRIDGDNNVRRDILALLADEETLAALTRHSAFFDSAGVDVRPTADSAIKTLRLVRLRDKLELATSVVNRHIQTTGAPTVGTVSAIHNAIIGTVANSPVRLAFASFENKWRSLFKGGRTRKATEKPVEK